MNFLVTCCQRGRKCIDHRLRERVCFFCSLLFLVVELCYLLVWDTIYLLWDTWMIMCLIICYRNACWMTLSFYISIWSFILLGDECMYLIITILSTPPRCMWHGRVTHDPNSLCICSPKQILNYAQIRGSSCFLHTSQSDNVFQSYYHLSKLWSICCHQLPKRGRFKVQLSLGGFGNS